MNRIITALTAMLCAGVLALPVQAGVTQLSSNVTPVTAPVSLADDALQSSSDLFLITESAAVVPESGLEVDIATPGTYYYFDSWTLRSASGTLAAGTAVQSYLLHFDPLIGCFSTGQLSSPASVTFAERILGVDVRFSTLNETDGLLGASGTDYPDGIFRGLEPGRQDTITLSADMHTLTVNKLNGLWDVDQMRVITGAVPEPATFVLATIGVGIFVWTRRGM